MKKIICLSAAATLIAALAIGAGAAEEKKVILTPSAGTVSVGEEVTVTISVENLERGNTFMFYDPDYNTDYLEWIDGEWLLGDATLSDYVMTSSESADGEEQGRSGVFYTDGTPVSGDVAIATMKFRVLQEFDEPQKVSCSVIVKNDNETELAEVGVVSGEIAMEEEEPEIEKFNLAGATMTLGNSLAMNFVIDTSKLDGDGHYAVITKEYADGSEVVVTVEQKDWIVYSGKLYYFTFNGVSAKEMTDDLYVEVYNKDGIKVTNTWTDSVRNYAMRGVNKELSVINNSATSASALAASKEKLALYVDMLNYGSAAQVEFSNYHSDDMANNTLTDEAKEYATGELELESCQVKGNGYAGTTLTLKSQIQLNFVFNKSVVTTDMYAVVTYTNHYGNEKTLTISGEEFMEYSSTRWYIPVTGMSVADCFAPITLTIYSADGTVVTSAVDSVESYVSRGGSTKEIYMAIMKFATSAYNSFH